MTTAKPFVMPDPFDGTKDIQKYLQHFEACCTCNGWSDSEKAKYLPVRMVGPAQDIFFSIPEDSRITYTQMKTVLIAKFMPIEKIDLYKAEYMQRRRKPGESWPLLATDLQTMIRKAYPGKDPETLNEMVVDRYMELLEPRDLRIAVRKSKPKTLDQAVSETIYNETIDQTDVKTTVPVAQTTIEPTEEPTTAATARGFGKLQPSGVVGQTPLVQQYQAPFIQPYPPPCQVHATVSSLPISPLVDSGSQVTLLNYGFYSQMFPVKLHPASLTTISTANRQAMTVHRVAYVLVSLGAFTTWFPCYVVSDLTQELLLGRDFLEKYRCVIDFDRKVLKTPAGFVPLLNHEKLDQVAPETPSTLTQVPKPAVMSEPDVSNLKTTPTLQQRSSSSSKPAKVIVPKDQTLPPSTELVLPCVLKEWSSLYHASQTGIIEGRSSQHAPTEVLVASSVCIPTKDGRVNVRLMSCSETPIFLRKGTVIATFETGIDIINNKNVHTPMCHATLVQSPQARKEVLLKQIDLSHIKDRIEREKVQQLIADHHEAFAIHPRDYGIIPTQFGQHRIRLTNPNPIHQQCRRLPQPLREPVKKLLDTMLEDGLIEESESPFSAPIVVCKKKDGGIRFCVDYRKLNLVTVRDCFPIPRVDDMYASLAESEIYSTFDLLVGYWQAIVHPEDREKTAFTTPFGHFQWKVLPMGMTNSPATFQRLMQRVLADQNWEICLVYMDDIIIFARNEEDHRQRLAQVLQRLIACGIKLKPSKCSFAKRSVKFLGRVISKDGIKPDPDYIRKILHWPTPKNTKDLQTFLGLVNYIREHFPWLAELSDPLYQLTTATGFAWNSTHDEAFEAIKNKLTKPPILAHPKPGLGFVLDVDASETAIGACLSQVQNGRERLISYGNKSLSKPERRYCTTRKELLALIYFLHQYKTLLYGQKVVVRTDHSSLRWLYNFKTPEGQIARWLEKLAEFNLEIQHRPGRLHTNADAMSRMAQCDCRYCTKQRAESEVVSAPLFVPTELCRQCYCIRSFERDREKEAYLARNKPKVAPILAPSPEASTMQKAQENDKDIGPIYTCIKKNQVCRLQNPSATQKRILQHEKRLTLHEGILTICNKRRGPNSFKRIVLPTSKREEVLKMFHDAPAAGHLSGHKNWCQSCDVCAKVKDPSRPYKAALELDKARKSKSSKFHIYWKGPYMITRRLSDLVYEIDKDGRAYKTHFNRLKPYIPREKRIEQPQKKPAQGTKKESRDKTDKQKPLEKGPYIGENISFWLPESQPAQERQIVQIMPLVENEAPEIAPDEPMMQNNVNNIPELEPEGPTRPVNMDNVQENQDGPQVFGPQQRYPRRERRPPDRYQAEASTTSPHPLPLIRKFFR